MLTHTHDKISTDQPSSESLCTHMLALGLHGFAPMYAFLLTRETSHEQSLCAKDIQVMLVTNASELEAAVHMRVQRRQRRLHKQRRRGALQRGANAEAAAFRAAAAAALRHEERAEAGARAGAAGAGG